MKRPSTTATRIRRIDAGEAKEVDDLLAIEEPLEIRVTEIKDGKEHSHSLAVTMRTPGDDFDLATGFLFTEGILRRREDFWRVEYCLPENEKQEFNVVSVFLREGVGLDLSQTLRSFYTTSACGVCGKSTLDAVRIREPPSLTLDRPVVNETVLASLPDTLRRAQDVFERTGGLHAAGLFRGDGTLVSMREDVGRHNAVDKVVGERFAGGEVPLNDFVLLVSGRASFEILQKALAAGIPFVAAVGAPSSLAVDVAREFGMTLVGFLREGSYNIYAGASRLR